MSVLQQLVIKYKNQFNNVLSHKGLNETEIIRYYFSHIDRTIALKWINQLFKTNTIKSEIKAEQFRNEGNDYYKARNYYKALKSYTDSIIYAPVESEQYGLAIANRSAVFYALNDFENCINDIKLCSETNYPHDLRTKLLKRLINCYTKLNSSGNEVVNKLLIDLEENGFDMFPDKLKSIQTELNKLLFDNKFSDFPELKFGSNPKFSYASNALNLRLNESKGRYVITNCDLEAGDVLFVEKPFAFVPVMLDPEDKEEEDEINLIKCYHCFVSTKCPIACENCSVLYCGRKCKTRSWIEYHRWECCGSCVPDFWTSIGVSYLAFRLLLSGLTTTTDKKVAFGNMNDHYQNICDLITHLNEMDSDDLFQHVVTSLALTLYLKTKTDFFRTFESNETEIGGRLLKHILQVIVNSSVITSVRNDVHEELNTIEEELESSGIYVSGVGIYPSVSMMNHSCDANTSHFSVNDYMIVKANRPIYKGMEILNNYGYNCYTQSTIDRQLKLKEQHYFECTCTSCTIPTKPEMFDEGLLCQKCSGCAIETVNVAPNQYKCSVCSHTFSPSNHFLYANKALALYKNYKTTLDIEYLKRCLKLRSKIYYKFNRTLYSTYHEFQLYYEYKGTNNCQVEHWWHYTKEMEELNRVLTGEHSLTCALHLRFTVITVLKMFMENKNVFDSILNEIRTTVLSWSEEMKLIFSLYYSKRIDWNNSAFQNEFDKLMEYNKVL